MRRLGLFLQGDIYRLRESRPNICGLRDQGGDSQGLCRANHKYLAMTGNGGIFFLSYRLSETASALIDAQLLVQEEKGVMA
jgi:hypothetical protein